MQWPRRHLPLRGLVLAVLLISSLAQNNDVKVRLVFNGMSQNSFEQYNSACLATVASAAGVPLDYVYRVGGPSTASSSSSNASTPAASMLVASQTVVPSTTDAKAQTATPTTTTAAAAPPQPAAVPQPQPQPQATPAPSSTPTPAAATPEAVSAPAPAAQPNNEAATTVSTAPATTPSSGSSSNTASTPAPITTAASSSAAAPNNPASSSTHAATAPTSSSSSSSSSSQAGSGSAPNMLMNGAATSSSGSSSSDSSDSVATAMSTTTPSPASTPTAPATTTLTSTPAETTIAGSTTPTEATTTSTSTATTTSTTTTTVAPTTTSTPTATTTSSSSSRSRSPTANKRFPIRWFEPMSSQEPITTVISSNELITNLASDNNRKLLAPNQAVAEYIIRSNRSMGDWASPEVIRRKVLASAAGFGQASSAGFGKGFYATLEKNGVPHNMQPQVYLDGTQILAGGLTTEGAPKSRFGSRNTEDPKIFDPTDLAKPISKGNSTTVILKDVKLLDAPKPVPQGSQLPLPIWAIVLIAVGGAFVAAFLGVFAWRCCCADSRGGVRRNGSRQQFLPSTNDPAAPSAAPAGTA